MLPGDIPPLESPEEEVSSAVVDDDGPSEIAPLPATGGDEPITAPEDDTSLALIEMPEVMDELSSPLIAIDDEGPTVLPALDEGEDEDEDGALPVIPWSCTAYVITLDRFIPCICDLTQSESRLVVPKGTNTAVRDIHVRVGPLTLVHAFPMEVGPNPRLVLGRAVLAKRAHVSPCAE